MGCAVVVNNVERQSSCAIAGVEQWWCRCGEKVLNVLCNFLCLITGMRWCGPVWVCVCVCVCVLVWCVVCVVLCVVFCVFVCLIAGLWCVVPGLFVVLCVGCVCVCVCV